MSFFKWKKIQGRCRNRTPIPRRRQSYVWLKESKLPDVGETNDPGASQTNVPGTNSQPMKPHKEAGKEINIRIPTAIFDNVKMEAESNYAKCRINNKPSQVYLNMWAAVPFSPQIVPSITSPYHGIQGRWQKKRSMRSWFPLTVIENIDEEVAYRTLRTD